MVQHKGKKKDGAKPEKKRKRKGKHAKKNSIMTNNSVSATTEKKLTRVTRYTEAININKKRKKKTKKIIKLKVWTKNYNKL